MDGELMTLSYPGSSSVSRSAVSLTTASPREERVLLDGFAEHPVVTAHALLCVSGIAGKRFYVPPAMVAAQIRAADPVVTVELDRLRFESFSACCGVHARFDMVEDGLDVRECEPGTTNVDFNAQMRTALARISTQEPPRISVGERSVEVSTLDSSVIERKVPLPQRWIKGFGEVQVALTRARPLLELGSVEARRFLRGLPRGSAGASNVWAEQTGRTVRFASVRRPGAVCVAAPARLRALEPLVRFASGLTAYGDPEADEPMTTAWSLHLPGGRVTVTLSPDRARGFSGEGGMLMDLVSAETAAAAVSLERSIDGRTRFTRAEAAAASGASTDGARAQLTWLGIHGHLGFDVADQAFFRRHLPFPEDALRRDPPRLHDARMLVAAGAVKPLGQGAARVMSGKSEYGVVLDARGYRCTCQWVARHGMSRGPCKHVLASAIVVADSAS